MTPRCYPESPTFESVAERAVWPQKALGRRHLGLDRSVDTHVSNLRRKLGAVVEETTPIFGVRGAGYMIGQPSAPDADH